MEKLKKKAKPHQFKSLIVTKTTVEFTRFEGEFESKLIMDLVVSRINRTTLKLSGFLEPLKVKCAPVKIGPIKHEWESFFRDNPKMNEIKPGYRPDTIQIKNLPLKWFGGSRPKTNMLVDVFKIFGEIKRFHIPLLDEMEIQDRTGFKKFTNSDTLTFEAFIMYNEYIGFVKAMDALRGMKLVKQLRECNKLLEYDIQIDFDKSKHLSDKAIKKRKLDKEYGIKNSEEMKVLKEEAKKQRENYLLRIKQLNKRKDVASDLLRNILAKVAAKENDKRKSEKEMDQKIQELRRKEMEEEEDLKKKRLEALASLAKAKLPESELKKTEVVSKDIDDRVQPESTNDTPSEPILPKPKTVIRTSEQPVVSKPTAVKINRQRVLSSAIVVSSKVNVVKRVDDEGNYGSRDTRVTTSGQKQDYKQYYEEYVKRKRAEEHQVIVPKKVKSSIATVVCKPKVVTPVTHHESYEPSHHPSGLQSTLVHPAPKDPILHSSPDSESVCSSSRNRVSSSKSVSPGPQFVSTIGFRSVLSEPKKPPSDVVELELKEDEADEFAEEDEEYETESEEEIVGDHEMEDDPLDDVSTEEDDEEDFMQPLNEPIPDFKSMKIQVKVGTGTRVVLSKPPESDAGKRRLIRNNF